MHDLLMSDALQNTLWMPSFRINSGAHIVTGARETSDITVMLGLQHRLVVHFRTRCGPVIQD